MHLYFFLLSNISAAHNLVESIISWIENSKEQCLNEIEIFTL